MVLNLALSILLAVLLVVAGMVAHEGCHYVIGWLSGGKPFFNRWTVGIPTQVDYESPESMSDAQVRLAGGIVVVFPVTAVFLTGLSLNVDVWGLFWVTLFFAGGSGVSWLDLIAATEPELWKRFTLGENISRADIE